MDLQDIYRAVLATGKFRIEDVAGGDALDCASFEARVRRLRAWLRTKGLRRGEALLFHGDQCPQALLLFWAAVLEGLVFVPVDAAWPAYQLAKACTLARPALAVVEDALLPAWQDPASDCGKIALSGLSSIGEIGWCDEPRHESSTGLRGHEPAAYLFTSGSTGEPKAVVLSHAALADSARRVVDSFGWRAGEILVNLADPHTMSGLRNAFIAAPLAGMHWRPAPRRLRENAFSLLELLSQARPQRLVAAPVLLRHVNLLGSRVQSDVFSNLQAVYCTGTDLGREEVRRFHARFGVPVVNYYGLTETVGHCLGQDVRDWSPDDDSLGRAVGCELRVVDELGVEVADGEVGELQARLAHPMSGYLDDPVATAAIFDGDWLRTGDLVRRDERGCIHIVGRNGSFIKTLGTEKVQPQEIEAVLDQHPGVLESAVYGLPDAGGGERIVALFVAKQDSGSAAPSDAELADFVRGRLGTARVPAIFRRTTRIPRSSNGKILRRDLRDIAVSSGELKDGELRDSP